MFQPFFTVSCRHENHISLADLHMPDFCETELKEESNPPAGINITLSTQSSVSSPTSYEDCYVTTPVASSSSSKRTASESRLSDLEGVSHSKRRYKYTKNSDTKGASSPEAGDECSVFGSHVASYLRKLPDHRALEAKADVLKVLSKYFSSDR